MPDKSNPSSDLQGTGRIVVDAVNGVTDLVEAMHSTISRCGGLLGESEQNRTKGITGLVYRNIRTISSLVGSGIDILLENLARVIDEKESSYEREIMLSVLNGVLGDYLADSKNPLAISMQLRMGGEAIDMTDQVFIDAIKQSNEKIVLLVHGSCMNDLLWKREEHDHGVALAKDLGYMPIYLRYNSGRHVSENGHDLAELLETFVKQLPPATELVILAHSMGGLVSRSACHYGKTGEHTWLTQLKKLICLGTPHHGALLERGGNLVDTLLEISPYSAPFSRLGKIRSAGVTDLRYGNILDEDWKGLDRFEVSGDHRTPVPLPTNVKCYAVATTTNKEETTLGDGLIGDGLVTIDSALGRHKNPDFCLLFPESNQFISREINHWTQLNHPEIYEIIKKCLTK